MHDKFFAVSLEHAVRRRFKSNFHAHGKTLARRLARELGLSTQMRDVRSCLGGPAVMGEVILHTDELYVMIHERGVMARTCNGRRDFTGDRNFNFGFDVLTDLHDFGLCLRGLIVAKLARQEALQ